MEDIPAEEMLPPAEKMLPYASVDEALKRSAADKAVALEYIAKAGEEKPARRRRWRRRGAVPRRPLPAPLSHDRALGQHKGQLFYYLKLQART